MKAFNGQNNTIDTAIKVALDAGTKHNSVVQTTNNIM